MRLAGLIKRQYKFYVVWAIWTSILGCLPSVGSAMPVPSKDVKPQQSVSVERSKDIAKVTSLLNEKTVQNRLEKLGLKPSEIKDKLASMNDEDLSKLARQSEKIQAGGSGVGIFFALIFLLLLVWGIVYLAEHEVNIDISTKKKGEEAK